MYFKNGAMIWNHSDTSELKMKNLEEELINILIKLKQKLISIWCLSNRSRWFRLFEYIKGDQDSIMGLPIKQIINYIKQYK